MTEKVTLVEGKFSPAEAADILFSLLNDKIRFHTLKSLHLHNEQDNNISVSERKIKQLKESKKIIEQLVVKAHKGGLMLEVKSSIEIKLMHNDHLEKL